MTLLIFLILVLITFLYLIFKSIKIVKETEVYIIERLGKFYKVADAGLTIVIPFVDKVRCIVSLKEQTLGLSIQNVITQDNVVINMESIIFYNVIDPAKAVYEIQSLKNGIEYSTVTTVNDIVSKVPFASVIKSRDLIINQVGKELNDIAYNWGIKINMLKFQNIKKVS